MIDLFRAKIKSNQTNLEDFIGGKPFNKKEKLKKLGLILETPADIILEKDSITLSNPVCPDCNSENVVKDGKNPKKIPGTNSFVNKQRFQCKDCGRKFTTRLKNTKKNDHHLSAIKVFSAFVRCASAATSVPLRTVRTFLLNFLNYPLSHESVRLAEVQVAKKAKEHLSETRGSGYYSYDEQWVKINGEWKFRQTLVDYRKNLILNERVVNEITEEAVLGFFADTLLSSPITIITTDGESSYPSAIKDLGEMIGKPIKHQRCTFHKQKELTKITKSFKENYDKLKFQIRSIFSLDNSKTLEECFGYLGKDFESMVTRLMEKEENKEVVARKIFNCIYKLKNNYPSPIRKYIESIDSIWENLTYFYSDSNISKTTNPNESYYSYSSGTKRRFKTKKGLEKHLICRAFFKNNFKSGLSLEAIAGSGFLLSL